MVNFELRGVRYKTPVSCIWEFVAQVNTQDTNGLWKKCRNDPITSKPTRLQGDKGIAWTGTGVTQTDETLYTACELRCNTHSTEVGWENGLNKTTVFHTQLVPSAEGAEAQLSTRGDLSCWICGNTNKTEENEGSVGID